MFEIDRTCKRVWSFSLAVHLICQTEISETLDPNPLFLVFLLHNPISVPDTLYTTGMGNPWLK